MKICKRTLFKTSCTVCSGISITGIYDKIKGELRLMREELASIERFRGPKDRSLAQCKSNLEAMQTTKEGLESELHQDLLAQLSVHDQAQVDSLNDDIQRLAKENKEVSC